MKFLLLPLFLYSTSVFSSPRLQRRGGTPAQLVQDLFASIENGTCSGSEIPTAITSLFKGVIPTSTPTSIAQATQVVAAQWGLKSGVAAGGEVSAQSFIVNALGLIANGFTSSDLEAVISGASLTTNSDSNVNPNLPSTAKPIYPKKSSSDAPYSIPESQLRAAIYIPPTYTYGKTSKKTVIMSPGTGSTGGVVFSSNIGKLLTAGDIGDPVYLNIPGNLLGDAQVNAEYVAYALNYMSEIQNGGPKNVSIITWSQGSLNTQWALKYWPSTRNITEDVINISPDLEGTIQFAFLCLTGIAETATLGVIDDLTCTPAVDQQALRSLDANGSGYSNFIRTLRANGGDTAYVPTTTIYSLTDEIVQPQFPTPLGPASGFISSSSTANASNTQLQTVCPGKPAGGIYGHEGVLYNPIAFGLVIDALTHDGPGEFSRLDRGLCGDLVAPGLSLGDVLETEALIPLAAFNILTFAVHMPGEDEPAIMGYAASG